MISVTSNIERILGLRTGVQRQELEDITAQEVMIEVAISEKTIKDESPNRLVGFDGQKTPDGFEYPAVPEDTKVDEVKANQ